MADDGRQWFVTRTSRNASTDEDRAMAHQQLGPFRDRDEARRVFAAHLRDGLERALTEGPGTIAWDFRNQYLMLLFRLAADPEAQSWTSGGVIWSMWALESDPGPTGDPNRLRVVREDQQAEAPAPTKVTVALNLSELSGTMRAGLLDRGGLKAGTRAALVRRGLLTQDGPGAMPKLTKAGERARDRLEPPVGSRVRHVDHGRVGTVLAIHHGSWSDSVVLQWDDWEVPTAGSAAFLELAPSEALGYLEKAVETFLARWDAGQSDEAELVRNLRAAYEAAQEHCPRED